MSLRLGWEVGGVKARVGCYVKLEGELGKLDQLKNMLGKLDELKDDFDKLLKWRMSWVSWMS